MADRKGKKGNTNASRRKKLAREALRTKIDGERELQNLEKIYTAAGRKNANIAALRLRADISFGKLKKILPDLRAVDHTSGGKALPAYHAHYSKKDD